MSALDDFGRLVMENLRDRALSDADLTLKGHWKAPAVKKLQSELAGLNKEQRALARRLVRRTVDGAIHDFLFALQEAIEEGSLEIVIGGEKVQSLDGLHGEPFSDRGWQARFSKYGQQPEEA